MRHKLNPDGVDVVRCNFASHPLYRAIYDGVVVFVRDMGAARIQPEEVFMVVVDYLDYAKDDRCQGRIQCQTLWDVLDLEFFDADCNIPPEQRDLALAVVLTALHRVFGFVSELGEYGVCLMAITQSLQQHYPLKTVEVFERFGLPFLRRNASNALSDWIRHYMSEPDYLSEKIDNLLHNQLEASTDDLAEEQADSHVAPVRVRAKLASEMMKVLGMGYDHCDATKVSRLIAFLIGSSEAHVRNLLCQGKLNLNAAKHQAFMTRANQFLEDLNSDIRL